MKKNNLPPDLQNQMLKEAVRIGDILYTKAIKEDGIIYWLDVDYDAVGNQYIQTADENIYNGNSGFLLFFIELYRATGYQHHLDVIKQNAAWIIRHCDNTPVSNIAFYSGRSGVPFVLLQVYRLTGEKIYLEKGMVYLTDCRHYYQTKGSPVFDILNGTFGILIALLHLYDETAEPELLDQMRAYLSDLCKTMQFGRRQGVYWDRTYRYVDGLCGFSHGVAGIAWLLTEIADYFANDEIALLARQALHYELGHFNTKEGNWPDYRMGLHSDEKKEEARQALLNNQTGYFTNPIFMCAWCHGAPGTGLALARIYELTGNTQCLDFLQQALAYTLKEDDAKMAGRANYSLCHGPGGNSFLLNKMLQIGLSDDTNLPLLWHYGRKALAEGEYCKDYIHGLRNDCPFDVQSLFNGLSGVGYFFLSLCSEQFSTNILCPQIVSRKQAGTSLKNIPVRMDIIHRAFPISFGLLANNDLQQQVINTIDFNSPKLLQTTHQAIITAITNHPKSNLLKQAVSYESFLLSQESRIFSNVYLHVYNEEVQRNIRLILEDLGKEQSQVLIRLSALHTLYESRYNWRIPGKDVDIAAEMEYYGSQEDTYFILVKQTPTGIKANPINTLTKLILLQLVQPAMIQGCLDALCRMITDDDTEIPRAKGLIRAQMAELIKAGIIVRQYPESPKQ